MSDAKYRFLPWVRGGLAAGLPQGAAGKALRATVELVLSIDGGGGPVTKSARLYGPGDVVGIDPRQVIRTDPVPGSTTFLRNSFPAIEFDAPELPWLLSPDPTPTPDMEGDNLKPWICLVVVRRDRATVVADAKPLPRLVFTGNPAGELPNLGEVARWAHAQVTVTDETVTDVGLVRGDPALNLSRLLCARRLDPGTAYIACVVPTYLAGVQAGLGVKVEETTTAPAWPRSSGTDIPVYYWWEFATSESDDFEALARRLEPRQLGTRVGLRPMDVRTPGGNLPSPAANGILDMEGALQADVIERTEWSPADKKTWTDALLPRLQSPPGGAQIVTPPLYGHAQAASPASPPEWELDLNTDPRMRAAAGLGTRVVQDQQEQLVAAAWEQADAVERANQMLRQAQLAQAVSSVIYAKRLQPMDDSILFQLTAPVHGRVRLSDGTPIARRVADTDFPQSASTAAFRRAIRPSGPIGREIGGARPVPGLLNNMAAGKVKLPLRQKLAGAIGVDEVTPDIQLAKAYAGRFDAAGNGWATIDDVLGRTAAARVTSLRATPSVAAPSLVALRKRDEDPISDDPRDKGRTAYDDDPNPYKRNRLINIRSRFRGAAQPMQAHLLAVQQPPPPPPDPLFFGPVKDTLAPKQGGPLTGALDPTYTVPDRIKPLIPNAHPSLRPLLPVPHFEQPMMLPLRDLGQEFLLPGLGDVPPETVGVLKGNTRFIEAYMTGLNAALARELFFRGYVTAPDATFFDRFWDSRSAVPGMSGPNAGPDLDPTPWSAAKRLGEHTRGVGGTGMTVMLIRGELVRQNRQLTVYLGKPAPTNPNNIQAVSYPDFRGVLEPDALYVGFAVGVDDLRRPELQWYFVLEEHVTAPRFGLDKERLDPRTGRLDWAGKPATWDDVAWTDMAASQADLSALPFVPVAPRFAPLQLDSVSWWKNGAHMAAITYQSPVRVAFPAADLLRH